MIFAKNNYITDFAQWPARRRRERLLQIVVWHRFGTVMVKRALATIAHLDARYCARADSQQAGRGAIGEPLAEEVAILEASAMVEDRRGSVFYVARMLVG